MDGFMLSTERLYLDYFCDHYRNVIREMDLAVDWISLERIVKTCPNLEKLKIHIDDVDQEDYEYADFDEGNKLSNNEIGVIFLKVPLSERDYQSLTEDIQIQKLWSYP